MMLNNHVEAVVLGMLSVPVLLGLLWILHKVEDTIQSLWYRHTSKTYNKYSVKARDGKDLYFKEGYEKVRAQERKWEKLGWTISNGITKILEFSAFAVKAILWITAVVVFAWYVKVIVFKYDGPLFDDATIDLLKEIAIWVFGLIAIFGLAVLTVKEWIRTFKWFFGKQK